MAVKTITIDIDAYDILSQHKARGQSFSQVIKQQLGRRRTTTDLRRVLTRAHLADDTLDAIEAQVRRRRTSVARPLRL